MTQQARNDLVGAASRVLVLLLCAAGLAEAAAGMNPASRAEAILPGLTVVHGPVNGVRLERHGKVLAIYGDPDLAPPRVEQVLFTHHRRDVAWAGLELVRHGARAVVPAAEASFFLNVEDYWARSWTNRFHDYQQQSSRVLTESLKEARLVRGGDRIEWEGVAIEVVDTPGYTRGAVSYLFEMEGKRVACVGDLIYGDGKILDLFSLQDAIPEAQEDGYHGYAARAGEVIRSLGRVMEWKPQLLVPARGPVIDHPREAAGKLVQRLQAVFANHFANDALRWYRGEERFGIQNRRILGEQRQAWMPLAETIQTNLPSWIVAFANSRLIVSGSGGAFLVDCGGRRHIQELKQLQREGRFKTLEGLYLTHYHDDHTDFAQACAEEFRCPVYACRELRDILERPGAYRMPALTANPIQAVKAMRAGAKARWHEFEFTYSYFPGQTLYHGGLLVKKDGGETIFFIGDSFVPSGLDDYCLLNRNFLEPEPGYGDCLEVLRRLPPDYLLINQHVAPAFRFSAVQLDSLRENFRDRRQLMADLFPWDDPNFGVDEQWARFYPYGAEIPAGQRFELKLMVLNHSPSTQTFRVIPRLPPGWKGGGQELSVSVGARREKAVSIPVVPPSEGKGLAVITADVGYGPWAFRDWTEALVKVK